MTIAPDRLDWLSTVHLSRGAHDPSSDAVCAMEAVALAAGEGKTDAPQCASPVLARYVIRLNDAWDDDQRQALVPHLRGMVGTRGDGQDDARQRLALTALAHDLLPPWLDAAGLDDQAAALRALPAATDDDTSRVIRRQVRTAADASWAVRRDWRDRLPQQIRERLTDAAADAVAVADADAGAVAGAVAVAVAGAVAGAAADAGAVAGAVAVAVAGAVAGAAAVAVAVAVDVAVAVAVADAAADAVADAAADAVADAAAVAAAAAAAVAAAAAAADAAAAAAADAAAAAAAEDRYDAVYRAVRQAVREHLTTTISERFAPLIAAQRAAALDLLAAMVDPAAVTA